MRRTLALLGAAAASLAIAEAQAQSANALLIDPDGTKIGNVAISQMAQGVRIFAQADGLPPGVHAFHIHENRAM